jgi:hypothetical protein
LERILLKSASFDTPNRHNLVSPIQVIQAEQCDFAASKPIDSKKQQNGAGTQLAGFLSTGGLNQSPDILPCGPFRGLIIFRNPRAANTTGEPSSAPTATLRISKESPHRLALSGDGSHSPLGLVPALYKFIDIIEGNLAEFIATIAQPDQEDSHPVSVASNRLICQSTFDF